MANTPNYEIDPNDSRLTAVKNEEKTAVDQLNSDYGEMFDSLDAEYKDSIEESKKYAKEQKDFQQKQTDLTIQGIENDIDNLKKDYTKEQSGAYVDWQKQSNQYGAKSEQMAATGLANTGYSESSQVSMHNQYQNRVAIAREAMVRAETEYKLKIDEAKLQNSSLLAEIAYKAFQDQTKLAIEQIQYKNELLRELTQQRTALKQSYWQRYQDVIDNINAENALKEQARVNSEIDAAKNAVINKSSGVVKTSETTAKSGSTAGNAKIQQTANKGIQIEGGYEVNTPYYQGKKNPDCAKYGTFSNGYQPKGISGHGKLTDSGDTITFETQTLKGHQNKVVQTVWKASDGSLWYWDGRKNSYVLIVGSTAWKTKLGSKLKQEHSIN